MEYGVCGHTVEMASTDWVDVVWIELILFNRCQSPRVSIDEPYKETLISYLLCLRGKEQYFIYCIDDELPSFASLCFRRQFLSSLHTSHVLFGIAEKG